MKKRELDNQEIRIAEELTKNPRISDNQLSRNTGIPLKSVNTKRKKLEKENIIRYYVEVDNTPSGTGLFNSKQLFIITFETGITRKEIQSKTLDIENSPTLLKHVNNAFLGEANGHVQLYVTLESYNESDIIEIFNAEIIPMLRHKLGSNSIYKTETSTIRSDGRIFHNYKPKNMENGKLKLDSKIFIYGK